MCVSLPKTKEGDSILSVVKESQVSVSSEWGDANSQHVFPIKSCQLFSVEPIERFKLVFGKL